MIIKPLFDKIVIKPIEKKETTSTGIILPTAAQEQPEMATVIAVGPGNTYDGKLVKMEVKVGDTILYSKYSATEFKVDGQTIYILRQDAVLAVIE